MAWVAEILRKEHRECAVCRMGPTHLYDPDLAELADEATVLGRAPQTGTPLCNSCLGPRLADDLIAFTGRCIVFEPALGPESLVFKPFDRIGGKPDPATAFARTALDALPRSCACGAAGGRFLWVPVEQDANLWSVDWLPMLAGGGLVASGALCGVCAAGRIVRSLEQRGLVCEAIIPPRGDTNGMISGSEV